ncbi:MAG: bifunctional adenosylcobinamide kinase/adenosylcobinamide-phosphate guanylyltransferase [Oscillospiraceae bacterium]|nr:bifunctional adenosylcobinamide kinase/adenosylcobinamide-phosphate guanylyltransferase [Oscillospiraceae bacterium]
MLTLVVGGAGSGKSAYAEHLIERSDAARRVYLATMEPFGFEARQRIEKHRAMRENKGFVTVERFTDLSGLTLPPDSAVLLEDMGNLCANELFSPHGAGENAAEAILRGVACLHAQCRELVIVSNEVFTGGTDYLGESEAYLSLLSYVNRKIAKTAERVCEVSGGIATDYKGEET